MGNAGFHTVVPGLELLPFPAGEALCEEGIHVTLALIPCHFKGEKGRCITIGGGTYVHDIEGGVAFGAEYEGGSGNMHGANEYITEESLLLNAEIMAEAIKAICG